MVKQSYTMAFATTDNPKDCREWWCTLMSLDGTDVIEYETLDDMIGYIWEKKNINKIYMHGLKYYSYFIFSRLLQYGFRCIRDASRAEDMTFSTLITNDGKVYSIDIYFEVAGVKTKRVVNKVQIIDTYKMLPMDTWTLCKDLNIKPVVVENYLICSHALGYKATKKDRNYLLSLCKVTAGIVNTLYNNGLHSRTIASSAIRSYKEVYNKKFYKYFAPIDKRIDYELRDAYFGGFNYLYPDYVNKEVGAGTVIDTVSMYPYVLSSNSNFSMPVGQPIHYQGLYTPNDTCPLFVQRFSCAFKMKADGIPVIRFRNQNGFMPNEYATDSHGNVWELTLASPDFKLFFENYDITLLKFHDGYMFESKKGLFDDYIINWLRIKNEAKKNKNEIMRFVAKSALNMLGGKFASLNANSHLLPFLDDDGVLDFQKVYWEKESEPVYLPVAIFMNSYSRYILVKTSESLKKWGIETKGFNPVIYHDTDSIHVLASVEELKQLKWLRLDDYKLGAWAVENCFVRGRYLKQKSYALDLGNDVVKIVASGLPSAILPYVKYDDFVLGFNTKKMDEALKKPSYVPVKGGCIIEHTEYSIE